MQKKLITLVILFLVLFFFFGCTNQKVTKFADSDDCLEQSFGSIRDLCYFTKASETLDINICKKISNTSTKASCIDGIVLASKNKAYCNLHNDINSVDTCLKGLMTKSDECSTLNLEYNIQDCYSDFFLQSYDTTLLNKISIDEVYFSTILAWAVTDNNILICNNLSDQDHKETCYGYANSKDSNNRIDFYEERVNMGLKVPIDWCYLSDPAENVYFVFYPNYANEKNFVTNINLAVEDLSTFDEMTVDEYSSKGLKYYSSLMDLNILEEKKYKTDTAGDIKYLKLEIVSVIGGQEYRLYQGLYIFIVGDKGYNFAYTAEKSKYDFYYGDVSAMIDSIYFYDS